MATETTISRPAPFVEDIGKALADQTIAQQQVPVVTQGLASFQEAAQKAGLPLEQQSFETDEQFKARQGLFDAQQRAALGFDQRQLALQGLAPKVAEQDPLQRQAQSIAQAQAGQTGIAAFQPFLDRAQDQATEATRLAGIAESGLGEAGRDLSISQGLLAGVPLGAKAFQSDVSQFMSPYQSQVIDATLKEFDRNRDIQEQRIRDQQTALGALGSGRAGVQLAEFGTGAARERALLQAGLLQQGFGQAAGARQQDIANRGALAAQQLGLGQFQAGLGQTQQQATGADITRLGQLGALNQAQAQAQLDAQREAARQATFLPQEQLDRFAGQVTGIMGGYPAQFQSTITPNPTPLQTALGVGTTLAGIYGAVNNPSSLSLNLGPK